MPGHAAPAHEPETVTFEVGTVDFRDGFLFHVTSPDVQGLSILEDTLQLAFHEANLITGSIRRLRGQTEPFRFVPKVGWLGRRHSSRGG